MLYVSIESGRSSFNSSNQWGALVDPGAALKGVPRFDDGLEGDPSEVAVEGEEQSEEADAEGPFCGGAEHVDCKTLQQLGKIHQGKLLL